MDKIYTNNTSAQITCNGCDQCCKNKLSSMDWLSDLPSTVQQSEYIEVQFKNTRKEIYKNTKSLTLKKGDKVTVEAQHGIDVGVVSMTGSLVLRKMEMMKSRKEPIYYQVYRLANDRDLSDYQRSKALEHSTMIQARQIAADLSLDMKIGDVEYQADGNKAIFYYIADGRVDFRQLIRVLADTFKIRVEMKQIGARQEAGRIGGIGPCGRPLCCSSWLTRFKSVNTSAARFQDLTITPQKLTGQCGKLKCCTNFEVDAYIEAAKKLPPKDQILYTEGQAYYFFKAELLSGQVTYAPEKGVPRNLVTVDARRAFDIIQMNRRGERPEQLSRNEAVDNAPSLGDQDLLGNSSITRFDTPKKPRRRRSNRDQGGANQSNPNRRRTQHTDQNNKAQRQSDNKNNERRTNRDRKGLDNNDNQSANSRTRTMNRRSSRRPATKREQPKQDKKLEP